ncbi:2Fe-2S iron-sulfur cluster binding domain-containing protein [Mycobacterium sp. 1245805.9]|uniref:2Fe-2S iron-sulfur cluster-binding protein n=1 Tax=Mycobacterium sp. 1245805.9 TaxID=1856862 RepID=UPI0007FC3FEC|nr:2Fe-2S iron-sulfur cluster binding domain-containing protein [Mycobacterium sp. 1245805.9]OBI90705.1 ferredoxin [Mycobacterium sp. 1245805.9]
MPEVGRRDTAVYAVAQAATVEVGLDGELHRLRLPRDRSLVDAMLDARIDVPHSCREGHCGSCVATLVSGEVDLMGGDVLGPQDRADGLILCCQARPLSDHVRVEF